MLLVTIFWSSYSFEGPRHCFWAWKPSEELRLGESFNLIETSRHFVVLVTIYGHSTVSTLAMICDPSLAMIPPLLIMNHEHSQWPKPQP